MNSKLCKELRKQARIETQKRGLPEREYKIDKRKVTSSVGLKSILRIINEMQSFRGFYRQLKREVRKE